MKAQPYKIVDKEYVKCSKEEVTHLLIMMPGPIQRRMLPVITKGTRQGTECWTWNGDTEKPTLKPSILTSGGPRGIERCHSWVCNGKANFLDDCSHDLAGQTLDLLDIK